MNQEQIDRVAKQLYRMGDFCLHFITLLEIKETKLSPCKFQEYLDGNDDLQNAMYSCNEIRTFINAHVKKKEERYVLAVNKNLKYESFQFLVERIKEVELDYVLKGIMLLDDGEDIIM
jgi:hypothetical protein